MTTQNKRREIGSFTSYPKERLQPSQDSFLQNNKYLIDGVATPPKGGSCEGWDVSLWFPVSNNGYHEKSSIEMQKQAISICRECPIRGECLMYSLQYEPIGIWGGFTESVRALLGNHWKIHNKRTWNVRSSFLKYRKIVDYIVHPEDIEFVRTLAHDNNLAQPSFDEWSGLSATAKRRIRLGLADTTR